MVQFPLSDISSVFLDPVPEPAFGLANIAEVWMFLTGYLVNHILCVAIECCSNFP